MSAPAPVAKYVQERTANNGAGRKNILQTVDDPLNFVLQVCELVWVKGKPIGKIAKKHGVKYNTLWRILGDLEPHKEAIIQYLRESPSRKRFWVKPYTSDFETVQAYLTHAKEEELKRYKRYMRLAEKAWRALGFRDPANWTKSEVLDYLRTLSDGSQSGSLDAIRGVAPQFRDEHGRHYISVLKARSKLKLRKRKIFGTEYEMARQALKAMYMEYELLVFDLHVTVAFREGSYDSRSGLTGVAFSSFKKGFTKVDDFESKGKIHQQITWRNCPVDLFFKGLPDRIRKYWEKRGKPTDEKLIEGGYKEIMAIYKRIRKALVAYWQGKCDPDILKEFSLLRPHDADKIHCNLCWEAEIPLEVVAGEVLGKGEGLGLVGRGWRSTDIIKKHYLSLTQKSPRYKKMLAKVTEFSKQFNGHEEGLA